MPRQLLRQQVPGDEREPCHMLCGAGNGKCVKQQVSLLCNLLYHLYGYRIIRLAQLISHTLDIDDAI